MLRKILKALGALVLLAALGVAGLFGWWKMHEASGAGFGLRYSLPDSLSPQAHAQYERLYFLAATLGRFAAPPATVEKLEELNRVDLKKLEARRDEELKEKGFAFSDREVAGVKVLDIRPPDYRDDGTLLLHAHGGGWVLGSAHGGSDLDALIAASTGKRILSIDYTLAPHARWQQVTDQVLAVYREVLKERPALSIGLVGESAGGDIVAASTLKARDQGLPLPAALVLLAPGLDLSMRSDTWTTLADIDPVLGDRAALALAVSLYAPEAADRLNPYVSPVYGDFTKGFPPVLLQVGTREVVLSDSVRLYQALKRDGREAKLDLYEGMTHVFMGYIKDAPEQKAAFDQQRAFWSRHLVPAAPKS